MDYEGFLARSGFEVVKHVGTGTFSTVYHVRRNGEDLAAKMVAPQHGRDHYRQDQKLRHLVWDACMLTAARGVPGVVGVRGRIESDRFCLLTQYIDGPTLIRYGVLSAEGAIRLQQSVTTLHEKGFVGLGLRGSNVRVDSSGLPWIVDLGSAKLSDDLSREVRCNRLSLDYEMLEKLLRNPSLA